MTANQNNYWRNREQERTNLANEAIKQYSAESEARYRESTAKSNADQAAAALANALVNQGNLLSREKEAEITRQNNDWRNILSTLGFVLPQADSVVKALGSIFG